MNLTPAQRRAMEAIAENSRSPGAPGYRRPHARTVMHLRRMGLVEARGVSRGPLVLRLTDKGRAALESEDL